VFRMVLLSVIGAIGCFAGSDISGPWSGTMETVNGPVRLYLTLDQHDGQVSGTVATEDDTRQVAIEKPEVRGDVLTFEVHDNANRVVSFRLALTTLALSGDAGTEDRRSRVSLCRADLM
jgi:hypothetical protein